MLKAVIFDMDGVLVDSEPGHARAAVLALNEYNVNLPMEYCYNFIGSTTAHMLDTIIKDYNLSCTVNELELAYQQAKHKMMKAEGYIAIPYTKELIMDLYKHGVKLAIASSSTKAEIDDVVKNLGISKYFDRLVSGTTVAHPKPAPDVFIKAMSELGVNSKECIIIEDSSHGVTAAKAAGVPSIGFINENSGKQDLSLADVLIEGFDEIDYKFVNNIYLRGNGEPITITTTKRLIIRELAVEDIIKIYQIYKNPEVRKYIDDIDEYLENEIEKHKAYIKNVYNFYGYGLWGVFSKDTGELIGRCGIQNSVIEGKSEIELGYLLDRNHWGLGYAIECVKAILQFAFEELWIERIVAVIDPLNHRSIKVAEDVGMQYETQIEKNNRKYSYYVITKERYLY
ncbi:MAG: HAD-superfamily hydrolase, subfamily variant 3 [Anaerocolumna sp.]|jgi:HAD superfamily hydrolase (TIGR01509 family)|nr:HAD-superfamily hydrolase, subfamily variant 3 [Anaerocolumna sp.]